MALKTFNSGVALLLLVALGASCSGFLKKSYRSQQEKFTAIYKEEREISGRKVTVSLYESETLFQVILTTPLYFREAELFDCNHEYRVTLDTKNGHPSPRLLRSGNVGGAGNLGMMKYSCRADFEKTISKLTVPS